MLANFRDILFARGYEVKAAGSGIEALEIARNFCPDILVADNNMPHMSGLQIIQALRQVSPDVVSILISGYYDIDIVTEALRQSAFDFLWKPVSLDTLTHSMQRAVRQLEVRDRERRHMDFLSIVSHELRAPLQAPLRYLENILAEENHLKEEHRRILQRVAKGIKAEVRLINNLLDFQYLESGRFTVRFQHYSLRDCIQEVVESFFIQAADKEVIIVWHPPSDSFVAMIDPEQIRQAIANILNNAVQHTCSRGVITVKLFRSSTRLRLMIRDEGPGIAEPYRNRIFEKLFQVPSINSKKGLGIGLYIAQEIVRAHNGEIRLKSKLGRGSIFSVTLPSI